MQQAKEKIEMIGMREEDKLSAKVEKVKDKPAKKKLTSPQLSLEKPVEEDKLSAKVEKVKDKVKKSASPQLSLEKPDSPISPEVNSPANSPVDSPVESPKDSPKSPEQTIEPVEARISKAISNIPFVQTEKGELILRHNQLFSSTQLIGKQSGGKFSFYGEKLAPSKNDFKVAKISFVNVSFCSTTTVTISRAYMIDIDCNIYDEDSDKIGKYCPVTDVITATAEEELDEEIDWGSEPEDASDDEA